MKGLPSQPPFEARSVQKQCFFPMIPTQYGTPCYDRRVKTFLFRSHKFLKDNRHPLVLQTFVPQYKKNLSRDRLPEQKMFLSLTNIFLPNITFWMVNHYLNNQKVLFCSRPNCWHPCLVQVSESSVLSQELKHLILGQPKATAKNNQCELSSENTTM